MKILELCLSPDLGGLELYMYRCCEALLRQGDEVFAVINPTGRLVQYSEKLAMERHFISKSWRVLPLLNGKRLARLIDERGIDALHVHWGKDLPLAALAKAFSKRKPRLVYTRQMQLTRAKHDVYHRFLYGQMDVMVTITRLLEEAARQCLPTADRHKVQTLYYGVKQPATPLADSERAALRHKWGVAEGALLVGLFGRIEAFKGQHLMLQALASRINRELNIHLLIVGHAMDQAYLAQLQHSVDELGLGGRVTFRDFVDNPQQWMQACDVVALTTLEETFGLVLAEAMRAGVAVLGSNSGGVPEIIRHAQTGLLFTAGDGEALAEQLHRYVLEPELRQSLALAGQAYADEMFNELEHFTRLHEILAGEHA
ncbi:MAG TPA: glycosyltransferase family 4 protein [Gammaproteobacteria bacterium]